MVHQYYPCCDQWLIWALDVERNITIGSNIEQTETKYPNITSSVNDAHCVKCCRLVHRHCKRLWGGTVGWDFGGDFGTWLWHAILARGFDPMAFSCTMMTILHHSIVLAAILIGV